MAQPLKSIPCFSDLTKPISPEHLKPLFSLNSGGHTHDR